MAAEGIVEEMARHKAPEEIELARNAGRIADRGFEAFLEHARPGKREYELAAEVEYAMRLAGADDIFILLSSGPHNDEMHEPTDRLLRRGDIVIGEITPVCGGLFLQLCRTVVLGPAGGVLAGKYDMLFDALWKSVDAVKPGVAAGAMSKVMNRVLAEAGYGEVLLSALYARPGPRVRGRLHRPGGRHR